MTSKLIAPALITGLALSACTAPAERPLMSAGSKGPDFEAARQECIQLAQGYRTGNEKSSVALGAVLGGIAVAAEDDTNGGDALVGALIGGGLGAADEAVKRRDERRNVVIRCMQNRGYDVIG